MAKGKATINTVLKIGSTAAAVAKVAPIKSYPALGNSPENLETTDLEDSASTSVPGVQQLDSMDFTMNYDKTAYEALKALDYQTATDDNFYQLEFGASGDDGTFSWKGLHSIIVSEGSVNGIREMTLTVYPSTQIYPESASEAFPAS